MRKMSYSNTSSKVKIFKLFRSILIGFFLADIAIVIWHAPNLLQPAHWLGLGALLVSGLILYAVIGLNFLAFYMMLRILSFLLRVKFSPSKTALITVFLAPLFLIMQYSLQGKMLGMYTSLKSPFFYVPTGITMIILVVVLILIYFVNNSLGDPAICLWRVFSWPSLISIACAVFIFYAMVAAPRINVLGVFTDEEQRALNKQNEPVTMQKNITEGPNFIVLKIEALRNDEFNLENAPFLWQLAQENIWFSNYYVVSSATRPSVTSFFSSLYPVQHGCYNLEIGQTKKGEVPSATSKVNEKIQTLPRLLQEHGYYTLMITSNKLTIDRVFGFEDVYQHFNAISPYRFRIPSLEAFVGFSFLKKYLNYWRILKVIILSPEHSATYFEAPRVNETIKRKLNEKLSGKDNRPFFLYAHYIEPHSPYYRHPHKTMQINSYSAGQRDSILDAYRAEIRTIDQAIADLHAFLKEKGLLDNTYLFISADHGEEFYDHKNWGHGKSLYPEVIHVPAIFVLPPGQKVSVRAYDVVENIDVMPTFAELASVKVPDYWRGESLVSYFAPGRETAAQTNRTTGERQSAFGQFYDGHHLFSSAISSDWQIIFKESGKRNELSDEELKKQRKIMIFHLSEDPMALNNLYGQGLDKELELVALLDETLQRLKDLAHFFRGEKEDINPKLLEQLRSLGYIK